MANTDPKKGETYSEADRPEDVEARMTFGLKRALATPPSPHKAKPGDPAGPGRHWGTAKASGLED